MLVDATSVVTEGVTNILNVHTEIFESGGQSALKYDVIVQDRAQLERVVEAVMQVPDVTRVRRGKDYS